MKDNEEFELGGSEYDIRQSKLQTLGEILAHLNEFHYRCISGLRPEESSLSASRRDFRIHFKGMLRVLFFEAQKYSNNDELIEEINEMFGKVTKVDTIENLEKLRLKVDELMDDAGLEMPRKKKYDPEKAFKEGL